MSTGADPAPTEVVIGSVGRPFGVAGDLYVRPLTDSVDVRFRAGAVVSADEPNRELTIAAARLRGGRLVVHFVGVDDRDEAALLTGAVLRVSVDPGEKPGEEDEYFDHQLIGLQARDQSGAALGIVTRVDHLPADDYLVVDAEAEDVLVPFRSEFVTAVDIESGCVILDPPPGLFVELDDTEPS